eukprot:2217112-Pyramimonas_sp.AAC.1
MPETKSPASDNTLSRPLLGRISGGSQMGGVTGAGPKSSREKYPLTLITRRRRGLTEVPVFALGIMLWA